jgi:hypothetical protein
MTMEDYEGKQRTWMTVGSIAIGCFGKPICIQDLAGRKKGWSR